MLFVVLHDGFDLFAWRLSLFSSLEESLMHIEEDVVCSDKPNNYIFIDETWRGLQRSTS